MTSHYVFGVRIDDISEHDVRALFSRWLFEDEQRVVVTPNPEFLLLARRDKQFREVLNSAHLALPDGVGLKIAAPLEHRVTGVDALEMLIALCHEHGKRLVTVGSDVADVDAGQVRDTLTPDVVAKVRAMDPDVVAVGLGQGKQEKVIAAHRAAWPTARILIGVGGAIEMRAGRQRRAPRLVRRFGLEWLWRLILEPRRLRRIVNAVIVFPILVFREKFL